MLHSYFDGFMHFSSGFFNFYWLLQSCFPSLDGNSYRGPELPAPLCLD